MTRPADEPTLPPAAIDPDATLPPADPDATLAPEPAAPAADPRAPAGYAIEKELGRGGMGVVYLARDAALDRRCALKVILSGAHAGAAELARFRTEAQAVARLNHPGIVQVFEVGEHDGHPYMALEFCPGGSLDGVLAKGPLAPRAAAEVVRSLAEAVQAAHAANVLHRDLKPANVLLTERGAPKVTDFGLAKKLDEAGATRTGSIMGTPSYMPPEQADGRKEIGPPADVYALGAILYECLTGRPPFRAATPFDTILQVLTEEPVPVRQLNPAVPTDLGTIAHKCLAKEPTRRYASARELADDLGRFLAGEPIRARPVGTVERLAKWVRRRPTAAALVAVGTLALLVTLVGGAWFTWRLELARRDTQAALDRAEDALGEGVLSALAVGPDGWARAETAALWRLATVPPGQERVRRAVFTAAVGDPDLAEQLENRRREAVHAAVGLSPTRPGWIRETLLPAIGDADRDPRIRRAAALVLAELGPPDRALAEVSVPVLLDALERVDTLWVIEAAAERLAACAAALPEADGRAARGRARAALLARYQKASFTTIEARLLDAFDAVARAAPGEAGDDLAALFDRVLTMPRSIQRGAIDSLARPLEQLASRLDGPAADRVAPLVAATPFRRPHQASLFAAVAARGDPARHAATLDRLAEGLLPVPFADKAVVPPEAATWDALARVTAVLPPARRDALRREAVERIAAHVGGTDTPARWNWAGALAALPEGFAPDRMPAACRQAVGVLVATARDAHEGTTGTRLGFLVERLVPRAGPAAADVEAAVAAACVARVGPVDEVHAAGVLARCLAVGPRAPAGLAAAEALAGRLVPHADGPGNIGHRKRAMEALADLLRVVPADRADPIRLAALRRFVPVLDQAAEDVAVVTLGGALSRLADGVPVVEGRRVAGAAATRVLEVILRNPLMTHHTVTRANPDMPTYAPAALARIASPPSAPEREAALRLAPFLAKAREEAVPLADAVTYLLDALSPADAYAFLVRLLSTPPADGATVVPARLELFRERLKRLERRRLTDLARHPFATGPYRGAVLDEWAGRAGRPFASLADLAAWLAATDPDFDPDAPPEVPGR